jgi:cytochrome P450
LIPAATEEFLRLYTPYRGFARTANTDVVIGGREIREREPIALLYASANRDETVFERPDEFILHRPNIKEHIAFGRGAHYCVGTALARLELRIMLEALVLRTTRIEVSGDIEMSPFPELGPWAVPVKLHTA